MLRVALTGNIASGKSRLLRFFKREGTAAIDSDAIVKQLYKDKGVQRKIRAAFGTLDRSRIAGQAFSSPAKRKALESILHPLVLQRIGQELARLDSQGKEIAVVEVPLLFEAGMQKLFDKIVIVTSPREQQLARLKKQGLGEKQALARMGIQLSSKAKVKKADFVIDNSGGISSALEQADKILRQLHG